MHLSPEPDEKPSSPTLHDKNITALIETLREKETSLRRDQALSSLMEECPRTYPKLLNRDPKLR